MRRSVLGYLIAGVIMLSPIIMYACTFGVGTWNTHEYWAEMGSALGGIYTPIVGFLTLYVIFRQVKNQEQTDRYNRKQSDINRVEADLNESVVLMLKKLKESDPELGTTISDVILKIYRSGNAKNHAQLLNAKPDAIAGWIGIAGALSGLKILDEYRYTNQLSRVAGYFDYELCLALDVTVSIATNKKYDKHFMGDIP